VQETDDSPFFPEQIFSFVLESNSHDCFETGKLFFIEVSSDRCSIFSVVVVKSTLIKTEIGQIAEVN